MSRFFGAKVSGRRGDGKSALRSIRTSVPTPSPPSPPGEGPAKARRGPWEGPAKARFAPGTSRGGPGAASRDLEAPGPCPGTPPAFRGQNLASPRPFCPLKPGRIREAPGGVLPEASAGRRRGAALRGRDEPSFSKRRTFSVRRMDTRARRSPRADFPRFAPVFPRESQALDPAAPGEARASNRVPARDDPAAPPGPPPADPGF